MEHIVDAILNLDGVAVYVVVGLLAFGEAAAFVGLFLPGEVAVLLGGVLASQGRVSLLALLLVVAVAAVAGDSAGYEIGRRWGSRVLASGLAQRHGRVVCRVMTHMRDRGGAMVFVGRWTSVLRAIVPAVAGVSRMAYGRFLLSNVLGGVAWAAAFTLAGYAAGESYRTIETMTGRGGWVVAGLVVAWVAVRLLGRRRGRRDEEHHDGCWTTGAAPEAVMADAGVDADPQGRSAETPGFLAKAVTS